MLPDLRFALGAAVATAILGVTALGLATSVRLTHQAKIGPLEASRSLAFADRADWNEYSDGTHRFEELLRRAAGTPAGYAGQPLAGVVIPPSAFIWPSDQMRDQDDTIGPAPERPATVAALAEKPAAPASEEPQATGTIAPRTPPTEHAAKGKRSTKTKPSTISEPAATATGDSRAIIAAVSPNPESAEPAGPQENATPDKPQLRKAAIRKRAKRSRTARVREVEQHASTGYPLTPVRTVRSSKKAARQLDEY